MPREATDINRYRSGRHTCQIVSWEREPEREAFLAANPHIPVSGLVSWGMLAQPKTPAVRGSATRTCGAQAREALRAYACCKAFIEQI